MASSTSERNFIIEVPLENPFFPEDHLLLSSFNLPQNILDAYNKKNIENIFPWQHECLSTTGVLTGRSLVISAPTSAGKMLIAELAAIMTILRRKKKVLIVMPFVSAVYEARKNFRSLLSGQQVRIGAFTGSNSQDGDFLSKDIAICTIEKGYSLLIDIFLAKKKYDLGLVIIDELHMIGEGRGSILELLLMKLLYSYQKKSVQFLGMSATLPNGKQLAEWLNAEYYGTDFRPIELKEKILIDRCLHQKESYQISSTFKTIDRNPVKYFCCEQILKGQAVLIFCSTRKECVSVASVLACVLPEQTQKHLEVEALKNVCQKLRRSEVIDKSLEEIILKGVGYHHAGLSFECRKIIEKAFRKKYLNVLVATTTLSMGVNLPAHLVIVKGPRDGIQCQLATRMYKQMVGRAGRKGLVDSYGESILICDELDKDEGKNLFLSEVEPSCSRLCCKNTYEEIALRKGLIDLTADLASHEKILTQQKFLAYFSFSFYHQESDSSMNEFEFERAMQFLQDNHFIELNVIEEEVSSTEREFRVLPLGLAARSAKFSPEFALIVFQELKKVEGKPNPPVEFAIYLVALVMDRLCYNDIIKKKWSEKIFELSEKAKEILSAMNTDTGIRTTSAFIVLYEITIHKTSLDGIAEKYSITALKLEDLQDEIKKFVSVMIFYSEKLEWSKRFVDILQKCKDQISNSKKISTSSASSVGTIRARSLDSDEASLPLPKKTRKSNVMKEVPTIGELRLLKSPSGEIKIINEAASNWRTIGDILELDDSGSKVSTIEERREAVRDYFKLWLRGSCEHFQPATWETLITILKDADLATLAKK